MSCGSPSNLLVSTSRAKFLGVCKIMQSFSRFVVSMAVWKINAHLYLSDTANATKTCIAWSFSLVALIVA